MLTKLIFLVVVSVLWLSIESKSPDEIETEENTAKVLQKFCSDQDFQMLVLTKWDKCMHMNCWEFQEEPFITCRREIYEKPGPCNVERKGKCNADKDKWLKCIDKTTGSKDKLTLKKEFQNNNDKLKELPGEKLKCFNRALAEAKKAS